MKKGCMMGRNEGRLGINRVENEGRLGNVMVEYLGRDVGLGESGYKGRGREGIEVGWRLEGRVYGDKGGGGK